MIHLRWFLSLLLLLKKLQGLRSYRLLHLVTLQTPEIPLLILAALTWYSASSETQSFNVSRDSSYCFSLNQPYNCVNSCSRIFPEIMVCNVPPSKSHSQPFSLSVITARSSTSVNIPVLSHCFRGSVSFFLARQGETALVFGFHHTCEGVALWLPRKLPGSNPVSAALPVRHASKRSILNCGKAMLSPRNL